MDWICDDEDYEKAEIAEDDLQQWAVNPFLPTESWGFSLLPNYH